MTDINSKKFKWFLNINLNNIDIIDNLGPHGKRLYHETLDAAYGGSWASVIILCATLIDVVANEDTGSIKKVNGVIVNKAFTNKDIFWLRNKRNSIIHYVSPVEGMMGGIKQNEILAKDAKRSFEIFIHTIQFLFKDL